MNQTSEKIIAAKAVLKKLELEATDEKKKNDDLLQKEIKASTNGKDQDFLKEIIQRDFYFRTRVAENPNTNEDILMELANKAKLEPVVAIALSKRPNLSEKLIEKLLQENPSVAVNLLLLNPIVSRERKLEIVVQYFDFLKLIGWETFVKYERNPEDEEL